MAYSASLIETDRRSDAPVSMKVVERVATVTNREATALPPLYDTIDPETLDAVINSVAKNSSSLTVQFTYAGQQVTVNAEGTISLSSRDE